MDSVIDQLSWEQFRIHSEKAKRPLNKVSEFNRLIAHSKNFFLISGYGAFTDGYILVVITPSFLFSSFKIFPSGDTIKECPKVLLPL